MKIALALNILQQLGDAEGRVQGVERYGSASRPTQLQRHALVHQIRLTHSRNMLLSLYS
jgi:hypothetical protein